MEVMGVNAKFWSHISPKMNKNPDKTKVRLGKFFFFLTHRIIYAFLGSPEGGHYFCVFLKSPFLGFYCT